jgi:hydroxymethylbilane synthase
VKIRLGTRASDLALAQTGWVVDRLQEAHRELRVELVRITTSGDRIRDVPLAQFGGKGLFVKEIEAALLAGEIDAAVHSLKDLPGEIPPALVVAAVPLREDPRDVIVTRTAGAWSPGAMRGLRVGTCSPRRAAMLLGMDGGIEIVPLRGNVGTRLARVASGDVDAAVLAAAGLRRLGLTPPHCTHLDPDVMLPAVGQGSLAIEARAGENDDLWSAIEDPGSRIAADAERAFLGRVSGNCVTPLAALATVDGDRVWLRAVIAHPAGAPVVRDEIEGASAAAADLGEELATRMLAAGGAAILGSLAEPV